MARKPVLSGLTLEAQEALRKHLWKETASKLRKEQREQERAIRRNGAQPETSVIEIVTAGDVRFFKAANTGAKLLAARERSGRQPNPDRDAWMLREYLRRLPKSKLSKTGLKVAIGKEKGLGRTRAINIIDSMLKK